MHDLVPLEYGHCYHIYNRGNSGENIFVEERNYPYFLGLYVKYIEPIADTFAYALLRDHLALHQPDGRVVQGLQADLRRL